MTRGVPDHKWWCYGEHVNVAEHRGDICYGWYDLNHPKEEMLAAIAMPVASKADMDAAAVLLGYHPTHLLATGSMFCDACATNVTAPMGMSECPNALPPAGTVIPGRIVPPPLPSTTRNDGTRVWRMAGSNGVVWDVEERIATRGPDAGRPYLYCPCPAWKFGHQRCKHTELAAQEK